MINFLLNLFYGRSWHSYFDGEKMIMRRRVNGKWEIRQMTDTEREDAITDWAIR